MGRAFIIAACVLLAACEEPTPRLPAWTPPAGGSADLESGRRALETVAAAAALDPADLWGRPESQQPDLDRILAAAPDTVGIAAVTEQTYPCPGGGTMTVIRDDQGPPWPSQGDSYTTRFDACVQGAATLDGTRRFTFLEMTGQPYVDPDWRTVSEVVLTAFTRRGAWGTRTVDGSGRITQESRGGVVFVRRSEGTWDAVSDQNGRTRTTVDRYRIDQQWDQGAGTQRLEFDVFSGDSQFGDVRARTLTPLAGSVGAAPDTGRVEIVHTDPAGGVTTTWITAQGGGQALVETDTDGDGIPDTQTQTSWFALGVERFLYVFQ